MSDLHHSDHHNVGDDSTMVNQPHSNGTHHNQNNTSFVDFSHPVYKKISAANGRINRMTKEQLCEALKYLKLSTRGTKEVLSKRLKAQVKQQHLKENAVKVGKDDHPIDYFIVIDFEGTCEEVNPLGYLHEIIEFPAILLNAKTDEIVSEFHSYCRPVKNPILSKFCTKLTGITQVQVDSAPLFETVLRRFDDWLKEQIQSKETFSVATDGPWDVDKFLKQQCNSLKLTIPYYFHRWVNVRKHFYNYYKIHQVNVELMLQHLGMEFEGRPHSGIDDARNISRILIQLKKDGADMFINDTFR